MAQPLPPVKTDTLLSSSERIDFGELTLDFASKKTLLLINDGVVGRAIQIQVSDSHSTYAVETDCETLRYAESCHVNVTAKASFVGSEPGMLTVLDNNEVVKKIPLSVQFIKPRLSLPSEMDFGLVPIEKEESRALTIGNKGQKSFRLQRLWLEQDGNVFQLETMSCTGVLKPAAGCQVRLTVSPTLEGTVNALLHVEAQGEALEVPLKAEARPLKLEFLEVMGTPLTELAFEAVPSGGRAQKTVHFLNDSSLPLRMINEPTWTSGDYSVITTDCAEGILPPGNYCTMVLAFQARGEPGEREGTLAIRHGWGQSKVRLSGSVLPR